MERLETRRGQARSALGPLGHLGSGCRGNSTGRLVQARHHDEPGYKSRTAPIRSRSTRKWRAIQRVARVAPRLRVGRRGVDARAPQAQRDRCAFQRLRSCTWGSWRRPDGTLPNYRDIASHLADYVTKMGFTHVELMPITEHPFYGSWGYQTTGYFAPTARYGTPQDLHAPRRHAAPGRHRRDPRLGALALPGRSATASRDFDGTHLYEHADPGWDSIPSGRAAIFNYGRHEVRAFLISSALFWLEQYHVGRPARGRGRLDALPRLRAQGRRVDSECARRQGEPRRDRVPASR